MAKTKVSLYDPVAANNTDINSINIAEGMAPSDVNNAIRELMAEIKQFQAGTAGDNLTVGGNLIVTGTSTLNGVAASTIVNTPAGNIAATTVQAALNELDAEKAKIGVNSDITSLTGLTTPLSVAQGGTGNTTGTASTVTTVTQANLAGAVAPSTSGNVLTSNGTTWISAAAGGLGIGQTWQNLTASRVMGTTYTNSTGKPIAVLVTTNTAGLTDTYAQVQITVDGLILGINYATSRGVSIQAAIFAIIPAGLTYSASGSGLNRWSELR